MTPPAGILRKAHKLLTDIATDPTTNPARALEAARLAPFFTRRRKKDLQLGHAGRPPRDFGSIRDAVLERAAGCCEACHQPFRGLRSFSPAIIDHWLGGSGRRREQERVDTCWALCSNCNKDRTNNRPNAAAWNERFKAHCAKYGYSFTPHVEHQELPDAKEAAARRDADRVHGPRHPPGPPEEPEGSRG